MKKKKDQVSLQYAQPSYPIETCFADTKLSLIWNLKYISSNGEHQDYFPVQWIKINEIEKKETSVCWLYDHWPNIHEPEWLSE